RAVERQRLQEGLGREPGPTSEQVVQLGRGDASHFRDRLDRRLLAPVLADVRDGAAHDVIIGCGGAEPCQVRPAFGREHEFLHHCSPSRAASPPSPPDSCGKLFEHRPGWPATGLRQGARKRKRKALLFARSEKACDRQPPPVRHQEQPLDAKLLVFIPVESDPERIEGPFPHPAVMGHLAHRELGRGHRDDLVGARGAIVHAECPIDQEHVESEEAEHRPGTHHQKENAGGEADAAEHQHEDQEAERAERSVGREHGRKDRGFWRRVVVGSHACEYRGSMAPKTPKKATKRTAKRATQRTVRQSLKKARAGKAAAVKGGRQREAADRKADAGALPQWTPAEVEEAFRRFQAAMPAPETELEHVDPSTLLIAVVLSAQATDAGVNKATPALFAAADTPAKMVALGEAKVRDYIKTIGLYRTKARNVIALSKKLVEEHGGGVPPPREALAALPRVRRPTPHVVP